MSKNLGKKATKIIVTGLVQGVGFRWFTCREAKSLGLTGYAKNLPTGQVEIVACGEAGMIAEFIKIVRVGPSYASVSGLEVEEIECDQQFTDFSTR